jgi:hypothetical protein
MKWNLTLLVVTSTALRAFATAVLPEINFASGCVEEVPGGGDPAEVYPICYFVFHLDMQMIIVILI